MLKRILSLLLVLTLALGLALPASAARQPEYELTGWAEPSGNQPQAARTPTRYNDNDFTPDKVYNKMIAMKAQYPEGMRYTNENSYEFQGLVNGVHWTGYGCAAFAFMLSDVVFGTLPVTWLDEFTYDDVRPGDILRINNDTHSVIVLRKTADYVELAEANYNSSVHWGRKLTKAQVLQADYVWTRYPDMLFRDAADLPYRQLKEGNTEEITFRFRPEKQSWKLQYRVTEYTDFTVMDGSGAVLESFSAWDSGTWTRVSDTGYTPGKDYYLQLWVSYGTTDYSLLLTDAAEPDLPTEFMDVRAGAYYTDPVLWALDQRITSGVDSWHFAPNQGCTRGQVVTFLWRAAGCPAPDSQSTPFQDVKAGAYYADAVAWAVEHNITRGTGETSFSPNDTCTRGQIVTFLYRFDALNGTRDPQEPAEPEPVNETPFTDVVPTAYYYEGVKWAVAHNITKGTSETAFSPNETCTRGQVVTFLYRLLG